MTFRVAAIVGATALTVASCGGSGHRHVTPPPPPTRAFDHSLWRGNPAVGPTAAPRFALTDQLGVRVELAAMRRKVVLVTFLYTHCPDVCPVIANNLNAALRLLAPADRARTRVFAVSLDPAHDGPSEVRRFIAEHRLLPQFRYLTGSRATLQPVWQAYNVIAAPRNDTAIDHSAYTTLVDRRGIAQVYFDSTSPPADIAHDVRRALAN